MPAYVREVVEEVAFQARADRKIDKRSGVSQRLPITSLGTRRLERRAPRAGQRRDDRRAARHRHLRGAAVDHRQVRARVRRRAEGRRPGRARSDSRGGRQRLRRACSTASTRARVIEWFDLGGSLPLERHRRRPTTCVAQTRGVQGLRRARRAHRRRPAARRRRSMASAIDFVLEGLYAQKKISRSDERGYSRRRPSRRRAAPRAPRGAGDRRGDAGCRRREEEVLQLS